MGVGFGLGELVSVKLISIYFMEGQFVGENNSDKGYYTMHGWKHT